MRVFGLVLIIIGVYSAVFALLIPGAGRWYRWLMAGILLAALAAAVVQSEWWAGGR